MPLMGSRMPDYPRSGGNGKKSARQADVRPSFLGDALAASQGELNATVALVLAAGGAIFLGMPKQGHAILVRCWLGGDQYEDYCNSEAEFADTIQALRDAAEAAALR